MTLYAILALHMARWRVAYWGPKAPGKEADLSSDRRNAMPQDHPKLARWRGTRGQSLAPPWRRSLVLQAVENFTKPSRLLTVQSVYLHSNVARDAHCVICYESHEANDFSFFSSKCPCPSELESMLVFKSSYAPSPESYIIIYQSFQPVC